MLSFIMHANRFIAERLVRRGQRSRLRSDLSFSKNHFSFALSAGVPVTIIRPGTIVGHTTTGAANATDYAPSIISAFAGMREYVGSDGPVSI